MSVIHNLKITMIENQAAKYVNISIKISKAKVN